MHDRQDVSGEEAAVVRPLTGADAPLVRDILDDAFAEDPVMRYVQPDRFVTARYFEEVFVRHFLRHGLSGITRDHTGVALWLPPGVKMPFPPPAFVSTWIRAALRRRRGPRFFIRVARMQFYVERARPKEPHYYLHALGVAGSSRGRGVGSVLLRSTLALCDREQLPACLECSNERNLPLYERHGFRVVGDYAVAPGGPMIQFMKRKPQADHCCLK